MSIPVFATTAAVGRWQDKRPRYACLTLGDTPPRLTVQLRLTPEEAYADAQRACRKYEETLTSPGMAIPHGVLRHEAQYYGVWSALPTSNG